MQPIYVPVLKGKEGEFAALEELSTHVRSQIIPLIEMPDVAYDYANERLAKTLEQHVAAIAGRLWKSWQGTGPLYLDLSSFKHELLADGRTALESALADCVERGVTAVPVLSRKSSNAFIAAASKHSATTSNGACIRLVVEDFGEEIDLDEQIARLIDGLSGTAISSIDVIIDLKDLGSEAGRAVLVARSVFSMIPRKDEWRRIILAAASFPEDLSDVGAAKSTELPRREWELWKTLQRRPQLLPRRDMIFGDYGIANPTTKDLDPRMMQMSASIRYTTQDNWLILKGRNVRQYGFDQYPELCRALVPRSEFRGSQFSWGDKYIQDCSDGMVGPGNATTWRKVGTNHHITLVTKELPKLDRAS